VFVGEAGVGKTAMAEGLATRLLGDDVPDLLKGAEVFSLDTGALWRARASAATSRSASRPSSMRSPPARAILFIDEMHSTVGAGATTGGTMDLATMIKPILTAGDLRVIGRPRSRSSSTSRRTARWPRRLQRIAIEEPSIEETVRILSGLRARYEEHHRVRYTDAALEAAAKLAAGTCATTGCPTAPSTSSTKPERHALRLAAQGSTNACAPAGRSVSPERTKRTGRRDEEQSRRVSPPLPGSVE
jgi:ATP-dependent Clp protease ATP-binding subunit ClpA